MCALARPEGAENTGIPEYCISKTPRKDSVSLERVSKSRYSGIPVFADLWSDLWPSISPGPYPRGMRETPWLERLLMGRLFGGGLGQVPWVDRAWAAVVVPVASVVAGEGT
jgi:hypothetical protein